MNADARRKLVRNHSNTAISTVAIAIGVPVAGWGVPRSRLQEEEEEEDDEKQRQDI